MKETVFQHDIPIHQPHLLEQRARWRHLRKETKCSSGPWRGGACTQLWAGLPTWPLAEWAAARAQPTAAGDSVKLGLRKDPGTHIHDANLQGTPSVAVGPPWGSGGAGRGGPGAQEDPPIWTHHLGLRPSAPPGEMLPDAPKAIFIYTSLQLFQARHLTQR